MNFHPIIENWFKENFPEPTGVQKDAWPHIQKRENVLLSAPTGSGKTLAAFLPGINALMNSSFAGKLEDKVQILYISPLKALSNDIRRNLQKPLQELNSLAVQQETFYKPLTVKLRTGDTPAKERMGILKAPPHILVTTPESLYLMLTAEKSREILRDVKTVIVDEIHALARDKRGSHLTLSLERLDHLCHNKPQRLGISATQKPMDIIAQYLCGVNNKDLLQLPNCQIIDTGHLKALDIAIETPQSELSTICSHEQWAEIYQQIADMVKEHRSTLIFVNTRRMAERLSHQLSEILGDDAVTSHHGSLSRELRLTAEEKLKNGELKAIVATASLELGIDIGYINLVCQIGSPRNIAVFLQRIGRSGHAVGALPKGRLFPVTRDELLESMALIQAVHKKHLDKIIIPEEPLDILAQQIIASSANEEWEENELYELCIKAWPYRNLTKEMYQKVLDMLAEGVATDSNRGAYIHYDRINGKIRARKHARLAALTSGGAIPENAEYRVVMEDNTFVGTVNEDFAIESLRGDVFILGNNSWRILFVRGLTMTVEDAQGAPATIPFWFGEAPGRTIELCEELSEVRRNIETSLKTETAKAISLRLVDELKMSEYAADQAVNYIASQVAATGTVPTLDTIIFERFFDESGGMQLVVHSPYGSRVNRAWGLAMRKRFCRSFNFELQAAADENGFILSLGPQQSFPLEDMFTLVPTKVAKSAIEQALLAVPLFQVRWRWNVTRALAVLRSNSGKRVPPALQRFRADDLLTSVFPQSTACLEHITGDIEIPYEHPLVHQTMMDCLHEALDLEAWVGVLKKAESGEIKFIACDTTEPSPFSYQLIHSNVYTFLDDAPAEERRTRALSTRRSLNPDDVRDLGWMDPQIIQKVVSDAAPLVRSSDELHDTLLVQRLLPLSECSDWKPFLQDLIKEGRAATMKVANDFEIAFAVERWSLIKEIWPDAEPEPKFTIPDRLLIPFTKEAAIKSIVKGRIEISGPVTGMDLAQLFKLPFFDIHIALLALENDGTILRGNFSKTVRDPQQILEDLQKEIPDEEIEWCERRLLSRIHRLTLDSLRRQIEAVEPDVFVKFLVHHQFIHPETKVKNRQGFNKIIDQMEGFEISAASWEEDVFPNRMQDYKSYWLDETTMYGETLWCRLKQAGLEESSGSRLASNIPVALCLRANIPWLLKPVQNRENPELKSDQNKVYSYLKKSGALFSEDLRIACKMLPSQIDDILWELAGKGLIIADGFASLRKRISRKKTRSKPGMNRQRRNSAGRWNLFPGILGEETPNDRRQQWAQLLLHRYGIIFRDLLERETCAPSWGLLVPELRRMEARGEIRGGRFVKGVGGEQYALPGVVEKLRRMKDKQEKTCVFISAVESANLMGIVYGERKVPARKGNTLCLLDGKCIAASEAGKITWFTDIPQSTKIQVEQAIKLNSHTRVMKKINITVQEETQPFLF